MVSAAESSTPIERQRRSGELPPGVSLDVSKAVVGLDVLVVDVLQAR